MRNALRERLGGDPTAWATVVRRLVPIAGVLLLDWSALETLASLFLDAWSVLLCLAAVAATFTMRGFVFDEMGVADWANVATGGLALFAVVGTLLGFALAVPAGMLLGVVAGRDAGALWVLLEAPGLYASFAGMLAFQVPRFWTIVTRLDEVSARCIVELEVGSVLVRGILVTMAGLVSARCRPARRCWGRSWQPKSCSRSPRSRRTTCCSRSAPAARERRRPVDHRARRHVRPRRSARASGAVAEAPRRISVFAAAASRIESHVPASSRSAARAMRRGAWRRDGQRPCGPRASRWIREQTRGFVRVARRLRRRASEAACERSTLGREPMDDHSRRVGFAKRIRVQMPLGVRHAAWDLRPFGLGRVIAPELPTQVEIAAGTWLDLASGEVRAAAGARTVSAA